MTEKHQHESLAAALAAFQASVPHVQKGATGQVGQQRYRYADLSDVVKAVLPRLGAVGLSFSSKPTINEAGRFVLAYTLRHTSGESDSGEYPLPETGSPQQMGSAQTYAKRYALLAITGVAPDEDDDGAAATVAYEHRTQQAQRPAQRSAPAQPAARPVAKEALEDLAAVCTAMGYDRDLVSALYAAEHDGASLRAETDPDRVWAFTAKLDEVDPTRIKAQVQNGAKP